MFLLLSSTLFLAQTHFHSTISLRSGILPAGAIVWQPPSRSPPPSLLLSSPSSSLCEKVHQLRTGEGIMAKIVLKANTNGVEIGGNR